MLLDLLNTKTEGDIIINVEMREKRITLEYGIYVSFVSGNVIDELAVKNHPYR